MTGVLGPKRWLPVCLLLAAVRSAAGQVGPLGKPAFRPDVKFPALLSAEPLRENPDDDEMRKLLKERYNAALGEARHSYALEGVLCGGDNQDYRYGSWKRVLQAGLEAYDGPAEKVALLRDYLQLTKEAEQLEELRYKVGRCKIDHVHRARYERLDAELRLLLAKRA
jgi:hypothetical protein